MSEEGKKQEGQKEKNIARVVASTALVGGFDTGVVLVMPKTKNEKENKEEKKVDSKQLIHDLTNYVLSLTVDNSENVYAVTINGKIYKIDALSLTI